MWVARRRVSRVADANLVSRISVFNMIHTFNQLRGTNAISVANFFDCITVVEIITITCATITGKSVAAEETQPPTESTYSKESARSAR
eukprot:3187940-Lingulodinium_polyedra.AAC.2